MTKLVSTLRAARLARGLSQESLARMVGLSSQGLRAIEAGRAVPATDIALRLARALGLSVEQIFSLPEPRPVLDVSTADPLAPGARVRVASLNGRLVAHQLHGDDGFVGAFSRADGIAVGPNTVDLLEADGLQERVVVAGCDPAIGLIGETLLRSRAGSEVIWVNRGSRRALEALARHEAHVAGCHLLDEASGIFNRGFVERMVPFPCTLITFSVWEEGLIVAAGNPRGIVSVADLARPGARLVNREPGAGSRQFIDRQLRAAGVPIDLIDGYDRIVASHFAVAAAVRRGQADAGPGIKAAALAFGLDFVPVAAERYDLVIPDHYLDHPGVQALLDLLRQRAFRGQVEALGGYDITQMGVVAS